MAVVALFHELEENVGLLGFHIDVAQLIDQKYVKADQAIEQFARGAVGERSVELIEQVLGANELTTVAVLQGFQQQARP